MAITINHQRNTYGRFVKVLTEDEVILNKKKYYIDNRKELIGKVKNRYLLKKDEIRDYKKKYQIENSLILKQKKHEYYLKNKDRINSYVKVKKIKDINFLLSHLLRNRISQAIKRGSSGKRGSSIKDLGCSIKELKLHLESQFKDGMTWENRGRNGWHIDHIKPLSSFDLSNREEFLRACHYTNLQPLWCFDNFSKGSKI